MSRGRKQLKHMELDEEEGRLYVADKPYLLFPLSIVELLYDIMQKIAGDAATEALMYRIGEDIGRSYAERIKKVLDESKVELDNEALLMQVHCTIMQSGWGVIDEIKWDNPKEDKMEICGRNFPCLEVETCRCALERGVLAGSYYGVVGRRIYYALSNKTEDAVVFDSLEEIPPEVLKAEKLALLPITPSGWWRALMPELLKAEDLALLSKRELEEVIKGKTLELKKSQVATLNIAQDLDKAKRKAEDIITAKEKMEKKLIESQRYIRGLIEASLDPLVTISPEGKITDVNHATELVTGCPREKLIGTDFSDYFTEPEKARQGYQQVFKEGHVHDYPLEIKHQDGKITPVLYNASVYYDAKGDVTGVFAAARDITEHKEGK